MFSYEEKPEFELSPQELQQTIIGFLGNTYKEVSQIDNYLINPNASLAPKKKQFENVAQMVVNETLKPNLNNHQVIQNPNQRQNIPVNTSTNVISPRNTNNIQQDIISNDPNQLEFSFDNSVTAKTIFSKIEDIEKRIKKIDMTLATVLEYIQTNDSKNSKQNKLHTEVPATNIEGK